MTGNGRFSEAQAAIALLNLDDLPANVANNARLHAAYADGLSGIDGIRVVAPTGADESMCPYLVAEVDETAFGMSRDALVGLLAAENVIARRYFRPGVHRLPPTATTPGTPRCAYRPPSPSRAPSSSCRSARWSTSAPSSASAPWWAPPTGWRATCSPARRPDVRAGIMQLYFFPYTGYFALVAASDTWVVFDTAQYTPKTWMNRNRVLAPRSGWRWVTVPVRHGTRSARIHEVEVADPARAEQSVLGALSHYRRHAPNWRAVEDLVRRTFGALRRPSLTDLDVAGLAASCGWQARLSAMPTHFYASHYRFDAVLRRVGA